MRNESNFSAYTRGLSLRESIKNFRKSIDEKQNERVQSIYNVTTRKVQKFTLPADSSGMAFCASLKPEIFQKLGIKDLENLKAE